MANKITINFAARGHKGVTAAVKALNQQVNKLSVANAILTGSTDKLDKEQKSLATSFIATNRATRNQSNAFATLRSQMLLASFGGAIVAGTLLKITNMAGDAAEQMSKASVVFGVSFSNMSKFAEELGDKINRSTFSLMEMAASVQDILVPMGIARVQAAELSKSIITLAADVGSFSNVASADVMRDFNSALVGNHETVRKYGIVISEARMQQVAMDKGIIKSGEALTDQQKILARLAIIQADSTDAIGDAERTADSYANVMQGLGAQFHETAVEIGNVFLPVVKAVAQALTLIIKLMSRPTAILIMTAAFGALAKKIIFSAKNMALFRNQTTLAIKKMRALKASLGLIGVAMIALEVVFSMWDDFFPDTTANRIEENSEKVRKKLLEISAQIPNMSLDELEQNFKKVTLEFEKQNEVLDSLQSEYNENKQAIDNFSGSILATGQTTVELRKKQKQLENDLKVQKEVVKGVREEYKLYAATLEEAGFDNEKLFKFQKKYTDEIKSTIFEVARLAVANNDLKTLQKINADAANIFVAAMAEVGMSMAEAQAETVKFLKLDELSQTAFGKPFKDLDKDTQNLLTTFMDLKDLEVFGKIIEGLQDQQQAVNGLNESQIMQNKFAEQGIKITDKQAKEIQHEIDVIKELKAEKEALNAIPQLTLDVSLLTGQVEDGQLVEQEKTTQDILNDFKQRHADIEKFEKGHLDKIARLTKLGLLEAYTDRFRNEQKILEDKKKLGQEELDFLIELEQKKQEVVNQTIDMAFATAQQLTSALQSDLDQRLSAELKALKQSEQYKNASDKKKRQMEDKVKQGFKQEQKDIFMINQAASLAQIAMNTATAISEAMVAFPPLGMPWSAIIGALGATQAGIVLSQKPPVLREGGYIGGRSHSTGGTIIEAEKGEFVMRKSAVESIGLEALNRMNNTGNTGQAINVNVSGNVLTQDFVEGELADAIKEAVRRGGDFGMS